MKAIEIDAVGIVLRVQEFPDHYTATGVLSNGEYQVMHGLWYPAPANVKEGDTYFPATGTLTPKPFDLEGYRAGSLRSIRAEVRAHIEADWPLWRQQNADAGILPPSVKEQKDMDVAACIAESNRVEDLIDAAVDAAGISAAVQSLNLPTLPVAI